MGSKTYNARYKLTWMPDGRRWRKKYRGKMFYFSIREGESKTVSYNRCLREWNATLEKIKAAESKEGGCIPLTPSEILGVHGARLQSQGREFFEESLKGDEHSELICKRPG